MTIDNAGDEVMRITVEVLTRLPLGYDASKLIEATKPNANTYFAGLVALFLSQGMDQEEIQRRFLDAYTRSHGAD